MSDQQWSDDMTNVNITYNITYGYTRTGRAKVARYATLKAAKAVAQEIFAATGNVVGIVASKAAQSA